MVHFLGIFLGIRVESGRDVFLGGAIGKDFPEQNLVRTVEILLKREGK